VSATWERKNKVGNVNDPVDDVYRLDQVKKNFVECKIIEFFVTIHLCFSVEKVALVAHHFHH
jgi:hypothetical protein